MNTKLFILSALLLVAFTQIDPPVWPKAFE